MLASPPESDEKNAEKDSPTLAAIKCAYQIMTQRIISNPKDMMGVLLFGTEKSKFQDDDSGNRGTIAYPHCYLLSDLSIPSASDVKNLKEIAKGESESDELLVPTDEPVSMSNMLFCANQIFTTRAPNFGSRRLFIITDRDDPHSSDKALRSQATVRAKDLYDLGVIIELFPISQPDHDFDRSKFYDVCFSGLENPAPANFIGYNLPRPCGRRRSGFGPYKPQVLWRRHISSQQSHLGHQLEASSEADTIFKPPFRNWSQPDDLSQRLQPSPETNTCPVMLYLREG